MTNPHLNPQTYGRPGKREKKHNRGIMLSQVDLPNTSKSYSTRLETKASQNTTQTHERSTCTLGNVLLPVDKPGDLSSLPWPSTGHPSGMVYNFA